MNKIYLLLLLLIGFLLANAQQAPVSDHIWTWVSGDKLSDVDGEYGTKGIPSTKNKPGGRSGSVSWKDEDGNLWLFGGETGKGSSYLNDLWKYDPDNEVWTWMSGSATVNVKGDYKEKMQPGGRKEAIGWTGTDGAFWLMGGEGYATEDKAGLLNDIWRYTPKDGWQWMGGDPNINVAGDYEKPQPGGRKGAVSWVDNNGVFWLYGGYGYAAKSFGYLGDLWRYDSRKNVWDWVSGSNSTNAPGSYAAKYVVSGKNFPGARFSAKSWSDKAGNLWFFGGYGYAEAKNGGYLNDVWEFDMQRKEWAWMGGEKVANAAAVYGILGITSINNNPGARAATVGWTDNQDNFWLFGGEDTDPNFRQYLMNDLWKYNYQKDTWTWVSGDKTINAQGVYGVKDIADPKNKPGARHLAVSWTGDNDLFWLFGGKGFAQEGSGYLNDLWRVNPIRLLQCPQSKSLKADVNCAAVVKNIDPILSFPGMDVRYSLSGATSGSGSKTASGLTYNNGTTKVIYTLAEGGQVCTFSVAIRDSTAPVPQKTVLPDTAGFCSVTVKTIPTANDNCTRGGIAGIPDSITFTQPGVHIITWSYQDAAGNRTTQTQKVIVQADSFKLAPLQTISGECSVSATIPKGVTNCGRTFQGKTTDPLTYTSLGQHTITWTFDDGNGITAKQTQILIVKDTRMPVPVLESLPEISGTCSVEIKPANYPKANDDCAGVIIGKPDSTIFTQPGKHTITWIYDDGHNNIVRQPQTVIVQADIFKIVKQLLDTVRGECSAVVTDIPSATKNCGVIIRGTTTDPLQYSKQGSYIINWTFTDVTGAILRQTQKVIVKDITAPVPQKESLPDITGTCSVKVKDYPKATDNCSGERIGSTADTLPFTRPGKYKITWTYDDGNNNKSTQVQILVVQEPVFSFAVPELPPLIGECSVKVTDIPKASKDCIGTIAGKTTDPLLYTEQGNYIITWTYADGENTIRQQQKVSVHDTKAPVPDRETLPELSGLCSVKVSDYPKAKDNCAGTITATTADTIAFTQPGKHIVTWTYNDGNGNKTTQQQTLIVLPDSFTLPALADLKGECSVAVTSKPKASRNCGVPIEASTSDPLVYTTQGEYAIDWVYNDGRGVITHQKQKVIVKDITAPVPDRNSLPALSGLCTVTATVYPSAKDNCSESVTVTADSLVFTKPGAHTITWTYDDGHNNRTKQTQSVTVLTGTFKLDKTSLPDINAECSATATVVPTASDDCGNTFKGTADVTSFTKQGVYTITWKYKNANGEELQQQQKVTIADKTAPVPVRKVLDTIRGQCSVTVKDSAVALDNCAGKIIGKPKDPLTYTKQGAHTITWEFTDANGNTQTQTQQVIVNNPVSPVPAPVLNPPLVGDCEVIVTDKPTIADACLTRITGFTTDPLKYDKPGLYTITWKYVTSHDDTVTQRQTVVVKNLSLSISAFPNPSSNFFTAIVKTCNKTDEIGLSVFDMLGRVIENTRVKANVPITLGEKYPNAAYFIQIVQGKERLTQKLIKAR